MDRPCARIGQLILLVITFAACTGAPFKVAPRVEMPIENFKAVAMGEKLELRAQLLGEDEVVKLFDGNLWLAGIIPVRVALTNLSQEPLTIRKLEFRLTDINGRRFRLMKPKDAIKKLIKYYGVRLYSYTPEKEMEERFFSHSVMLNKELPAAESCQGLIYFEQAKESPQPEGLRLQLSGVKPEGTLVLMLN